MSFFIFLLVSKLLELLPSFASFLYKNLKIRHSSKRQSLIIMQDHTAPETRALRQHILQD